MGKKTVLVASRHPALADVRKHILEQAGYEVVSTSEPEAIKEACQTHKIDLILVGYSLSPAEKRQVAAEAITFCKCPIVELWESDPPRIRIDHRIFDHYSLTPEDFLQTVQSILGGTPLCAVCRKPCPLEDCVTDSRGCAVHSECYAKTRA